MPNTQAVTEADTSYPAMRNRRAWVRYPCDLDSSCQALMAARGLQWTAKVRNVSQGGIAVTMQRRFELGTLLAFEVQGPPGKSSVSLLGRVAHVTAKSDGSWLIGCAFSTPLTEADLKALL